MKGKRGPIWLAAAGLLVGCATVRRGCGCMHSDPMRISFMREESVAILPESPGSGFPLFLATPPYSDRPGQLRQPGIATVRVSVGDEGLVRMVEVLESTHRELDAAITEAAWTWRFMEIPDPFTGKRQGLEVECRLAFAEPPR